uniref:DUF2283 domain-containing protein n=1 Tax=Fervidicoccus fontis TaxID=683846 RepID=A0A7J3ZJQ4_9CREN
MEEVRKERTLKVNIGHVWFDYDSQNDILYVNFGDGEEEAEEEVLVDSDVVVRIKQDRMLGLMVLEFSKKIQREIL